MSSTFERYKRAAARLDELIEHSSAPEDKSREAVQARAELRMGRLRAFLRHFGSPQDRYPIVHVGGTSGKGSTSTTIAAILTAAGYRTGLHISPYLQTPLEKLQLNGNLIDPEHFTSLVDRLLAAHEAWIGGGGEPLTYGELWMALTVFFFADAGVEVAVLEVGAGGRFDLTNVITPAVSVITSVGIDHTNTLGSTIEEIAWHKAGIIKRGIPAVTAATHPVALAIIRAEASAQG
ncbi:MAG TPA: Mur ligase family protein, partial [Thermomicrobiales bacterium]|nr:Mur ligase family protein [Thermomicrobiales bacterium]